MAVFHHLATVYQTLLQFFKIIMTTQIGKVVCLTFRLLKTSVQVKVALSVHNMYLGLCWGELHTTFSQRKQFVHPTVCTRVCLCICICTYQNPVLTAWVNSLHVEVICTFQFSNAEIARNQRCHSEGMDKLRVRVRV